MRVTLKGAKDLQDLANDLRRAGGTLRREVAEALREPTKEAERAAKRAIESLRIVGVRTGSRHRFTHVTPGGHIRARIARVIESDVSTSATNPHAQVVVRSERLGNAHNVPWHLESGRVFRHPLPNTRDTWAGSRGGPWFYQSVDEERFARAIQERLDAIADKIERG